MFRSTKKKKKFNSARRRTEQIHDGVEENNDDGGTGNEESNIDEGRNGYLGDDKQEIRDEEEEPSAFILAQKHRKNKKLNNNKGKGKKTGGIVVRSFDVNETDGENEDQRSSKKYKKNKHKKRKQKLGFGGGGGGTESMHTDDDDKNGGDRSSTTHSSNNVINDDNDGNGFQVPSYGKQALERLKSEQKRQEITVVSQSSLLKPHLLSSVAEPFTDSDNRNDHQNMPSESFIRLDESNNANIRDGIVLTGEEADRHCESHYSQKKTVYENEAMFPEHQLPQIESSWEAQIERRAGIKASTPSLSISSSKILPLDELSNKIKSTLEAIETQSDGFNNSVIRRKADGEHAIAESKIQEETLKNTGRACEFYQKARRDIVPWVGALRDLHNKVQPILREFHEMYKVQNIDFDREFLSWQDDCIAILREKGLLDRVLGRQSCSNIDTDSSNGIDEFGRDIRPQYLRDRDLRFQKRSEKTTLSFVGSINHNNIDGTLVDNSITHKERETLDNSQDIDNIFKMMMYEDHNEDERSKALHEALTIALQDLDQDYLSVTQLKNVFNLWLQTYNDDYRQCFATLSFGDLFAVLVQVQICRSNFFPDLLSESFRVDEKLPPSSTKLDSFFVDRNENDSVEHINRNERAVEKSLLPIIAEILGGSSFCLFFSSSKTVLIANLINVTKLQLQNSSSTQAKIQALIYTAISTSFGSVAIPIPRRNVETNKDAAVSIRFASMHLVKILQRMLCNIITHWFPLISLDSPEGENSIHFVLNFINDKYLIILSSLDTAKTLFAPIWNALNKDSRKIVESPSLMMLTMPLRAAAHAYQLNG